MKLTLHYPFGKEGDFEYEADVDACAHLGELLESKYADAESAVSDLCKRFGKDPSDRMLKAKTFAELGDAISEEDPEWGEEIASSDTDFASMLSESEEVLDEFEDDARDAYLGDGCDPDGFQGWGDYLRWKNG